MADKYLDNELDCDESLEFTRHLSECPGLKQLVASRESFRSRLRTAARATATPPGLETKIRAKLEQPQRNFIPGWPALALAAALLLTVGIASNWRNGGMRFSRESQIAYIDSLRPGLAPVMQIGLQQHIHCAVYRKLTAPYPSVEEMVQELGHSDADLVNAMQRGLPSGFRVVLAHRCHFNNRDYIHLAAMDGKHLVSLLITDRAHGEAFENDLRAVATENDTPVYTSSVQKFSISGFETRDHLIYLVSDLDPAENLSAFGEMVPEIARTIRTRES